MPTSTALSNPTRTITRAAARALVDGGGCPLFEDGPPIGAIGVSGGNLQQDQQTASARSPTTSHGYDAAARERLSTVADRYDPTGVFWVGSVIRGC